MTQRILITGAAGFIGFHLASRLAQDAGSELILVDDLRRGRRDEALTTLLERPNVRFVERDLRQPGALADLGGPFDLVFHLAAIVGVKHCLARPAEVLDVNLRTTLEVLKDSITAGCGKFVFASTSEIYASGVDMEMVPIPTPEGIPIVVADPAHPRTSYAVSKLAGEQLTRFQCQAAKVPFLIVRFHNVYGPRMGYSHVIPEVMARLWSGENPLRVFGAKQTRAFCYVEDAVDAVLLSVAHIQDQVVHIGTDEEVTIEALYRRIEDVIGRKAEHEEEAAHSGAVNRRCPDIRFLRESTGYSPAVPLPEGIRRTWEWYEPALKAQGVTE